MGLILKLLFISMNSFVIIPFLTFAINCSNLSNNSLRIGLGDQIKMKELIGCPGLEFCGSKFDSDHQELLPDLQMPEKQQDYSRWN